MDGGFWHHASPLIPARVVHEVERCEGVPGPDGLGGSLLNDAVVGSGMELAAVQGDPGLTSVIGSSTVGEVEARMQLKMLKRPRYGDW